MTDSNGSAMATPVVPTHSALTQMSANFFNCFFIVFPFLLLVKPVGTCKRAKSMKAGALRAAFVTK
jgi:hypothetical protein